MFVDSIRAVPAGVGDYSASLPVVSQLSLADGWRLEHPVTFLTGANGSGKSTLIEAIACRLGFNAAGGPQADFTRGTEWTTSKLHSRLYMTGSKPLLGGYFLRSETHYEVCDHVHAMSHGQSIMAVADEYFFNKWLFILDEPEAGLSPVHQMALLGYISRIARGGGQFIIATHSPILLAVPGAEIYHLDAGLERVRYDDHPLVTATTDFFAHRTERVRCAIEKVRRQG
ncbi:AAA family ATPase [Corynebacterium sp. H127]|uniref:AAA family ATPase n=1 Tax=Corynebacterium sp. H127 TaxID=3133418 RepID=UPI0030A27BDD